MVATTLESQGVKFQRGNGAASEIFSDVGEVRSFKGPGGSAKVIDVTNLASSAKEKRMGLPDEGQFQLGLALNPADTAQMGLKSDRAARTLRNFKLLLTDAGPTTVSFAGYVLEFSISGEVDNVIMASVTIEISGPATWA